MIGSFQFQFANETQGALESNTDLPKGWALDRAQKPLPAGARGYVCTLVASPKDPPKEKASITYGDAGFSLSFEDSAAQPYFAAPIDGNLRAALSTYETHGGVLVHLITIT